MLPGSLHPTGNYYVATSGDWTNIPTIPQAQADALIAVARKLDEAPHTKRELRRMEAQARAAVAAHQRRAARNNGKASVIDAFNDAHDVADVLVAQGYTRFGDKFIRPSGEWRRRQRAAEPPTAPTGRRAAPLARFI